MTSAKPAVVTVFCVDDHCGFRAAIRDLIEATPGFVLVGEAASGEEALISVPAARPDLVLMDVNMPGIGGVEAAERLAKGRRELVIVLISANPMELRHGYPPHGGEIATLSKAELCPRMLLDVWHGRRTR